MRLKDSDFHSHIKARMFQRGITKGEIETTLYKGWKADDAKIGTEGKVFVFNYNRKWEGKFYKEKELEFIINILKIN